MKPFQVMMTHLKNVARHHRPPVFEEKTTVETVWASSFAQAARIAAARHGRNVRHVFLPVEWADVKF